MDDAIKVSAGSTLASSLSSLFVSWDKFFL
jgi:hypothetical protein